MEAMAVPAIFAAGAASLRLIQLVAERIRSRRVIARRLAYIHGN